MLLNLTDLKCTGICEIPIIRNLMELNKEKATFEGIRYDIGS